MTARLALGFICSSGILLPWAATAAPVMPPMAQMGPQSRSVDPAAYAHVVRVGPGEKYETPAAALNSITDASAKNRFAILVTAGTYNESRLQMKPHVDLYG